MQIIGHRGASGYAPENTLKAFELALSQGCEWLELDVHLLDGKLIVIHDEQLDRTTSGQGLVSDHSLDAIRRLDAGDSEKIPYLDEVIEMVDGQASINIELKGPGTAQPTSALLDAWCLEHRADPNKFLLSSFNHRELALASPRYARGALLWPSMLQRARRCGCIASTRGSGGTMRRAKGRVGALQFTAGQTETPFL